MSLEICYLVLSFVALFFGADWALSAAEKIGYFLRLSPLVIGLFLIGFGTSLPEFFVSQLACWHGHPQMALGNVLGSNVANIYLILGVSTLIVQLGISSKELRQQLVLHLVLTITLCGVLLRGKIDFISTAVLSLFFIFYLVFTLKKMSQTDSGDTGTAVVPRALDYLKLLGGFALLYVGGELLVSSGSSLARSFGVSEYVISAIFVAFGTSFPELVTALLACKRKKDVNIIIGNIVGSNLFNVAFVLASLGPYQFAVNSQYRLEQVSLLGVSIFFVLASRLSDSIFRKTGVLFLLGYSYIVYSWANQ